MWLNISSSDTSVSGPASVDHFFAEDERPQTIDEELHLDSGKKR